MRKFLKEFKKVAENPFVALIVLTLTGMVPLAGTLCVKSWFIPLTRIVFSVFGANIFTQWIGEDIYLDGFNTDTFLEVKSIQMLRCSLLWLLILLVICTIITCIHIYEDADNK